MTIDERFEEAAEAIRSYIAQTGDADNPDMFSTLALAAAFPELFDGSGWVAPLQITPVIEATIAASLDHPSVFMGGPSQQSRRNARRLWEALTYDQRQARHLSLAAERE